MASYYYLMSSLPMLRADGEMPLTYEEFLSRCRGSVSDQRYEMLSSLSVDSSEGPLVSDWAAFYGKLKAELTYQRSVRLGRGIPAPTERDDAAVRAVSAAMNEKDPLAAEKLLLAMEFEQLDALVSLHYFDEAALIGYALKLKLLERKTIFRFSEGKAELEGIVASIQDQIVRI